MWKRTVLVCMGAVAALVVAAGCSSGDSDTQHTGGHDTSAAQAPTTDASNSQDHNDTDVGFAQQMIPHHQQAIEMSDIVLAKQGIDPRVTDLASKIKAAQGPEINQMQGWLTQWGIPPTTGGGHSGHDMGDMGDMGDSMGMMSPDKMTALKNAQGAEASKLFLTGMIAHHEGAIAMAQPEIGNGQSSQAIALAKSIATSQQQEIDTMREILATL